MHPHSPASDLGSGHRTKNEKAMKTKLIEHLKSCMEALLIAITIFVLVWGGAIMDAIMR